MDANGAPLLAKFKTASRKETKQANVSFEAKCAVFNIAS